MTFGEGISDEFVWTNIVKKKDPPKDWKKYENEKNKYEKYFSDKPGE